MKRPRIALWIKWYGGVRWWCPDWLWRLALRRVERWHEQSDSARQRYYDWLFSGPRLKGVVYDAKTHRIEIGDGPIFDKLWEEFSKEYPPPSEAGP